MLQPSDIESWLVAGALGAARAVPLTWLVPGLGGRHAPAEVRVALGVALAALAAPLLLGPASHLRGLGAPMLVVLIGREILVGVVVGLVVSFLFQAAEAAGRLTDVLRGAAMAEVISPVSEERTSPLGDLALLLAVVTFLETGGVGHVTTALVRSYDAVPIGGVSVPVTFQRAAELVMASSARLLESAVGLAAPAVVAFLLADLALGAVARAAPQIPVYFAAMPVKAFLGVGVVLVGLGGLEVALERGWRGLPALLARAFGVFAG